MTEHDEQPLIGHPYEPTPHSVGDVCVHMVMRDGGGDQCGHPRARHDVPAPPAMDETCRVCNGEGGEFMGEIAGVDPCNACGGAGRGAAAPVEAVAAAGPVEPAAADVEAEWRGVHPPSARVAAVAHINVAAQRLRDGVVDGSAPEGLSVEVSALLRRARQLVEGEVPVAAPSAPTEAVEALVPALHAVLEAHKASERGFCATCGARSYPTHQAERIAAAIGEARAQDAAALSERSTR